MTRMGQMTQVKKGHSTDYTLSQMKMEQGIACLNCRQNAWSLLPNVN